MATDEPVTPADRDLADVLTAIVHLHSAIGVLAGSLPPEKAKQLAKELSLVKSAIGSIIHRHDPQSVEFGENSGGQTVVLTKPFPPAPPRPPGTK